MINYKFTYQAEESSSKKTCEGSLEIDNKTWEKIEAICQERKCEIADLLEHFFENLTIEEANEIIWKFDN